MPADYKSRSNGRDKKPMPGFVWFLAGLVLGLFVTLIVYLDKQPGNNTSFGAAVQQELDKLRNSSADSTDKKPADKKPEEKKSKEPRFNFYTILPELEVLIPDAETTMPGKNRAQPSSETGTAATNKQYVLQTGSFRNRGDADKLKARLALLGFEASIQSVTVNREDWHRVRVGPYRSTAEMYRNLNLLQQHDVDAMAMELK